MPYKKGRLASSKAGRWLPTAKWWAATTTAAGSVVLLFWVGDGVNTGEEKTLVVGLLVQRVIAYAVPNVNEGEA